MSQVARTLTQEEFKNQILKDNPLPCCPLETYISLLVIGLLVTLAGLFTIFAACQLFPNGVNAISQFGPVGWLGGIFLLTGGVSLSGFAGYQLRFDRDRYSDWRIPGTTWLSQEHLRWYCIYLSTKYLQLGFPFGAFPIHHNFDTLENYLFNDLHGKYVEYDPQLDLPIFLDIGEFHWGLVYIDRKRRQIEFYDSKVNYEGQRAIFMANLKKIAKRLSDQEPKQPPYKCVAKINTILQPDWYQCGIWVLYF